MAAWGKAPRFLLSDEEMGKKDDDHRRPGPGWHPKRGPQRRHLKRAAVTLLVVALIYLFVHNIPTDLGPVRSSRPHYSGGGQQQHGPPGRNPQAGGRRPAAGDANDAAAAAAANSEPPKFYDLAPSLHAIAGTRGGMLVNKNVLFAASSLKSAATLLPVACQMGREARSYVHFALMSRSDIDMEELQRVNGVDEGCQIIFHDARPEGAAAMADDRLEYAVFRAYHHIFMWMHPQAIIVDGSGWEEYFFTGGTSKHVKAMGATLIELPYSAQNLMWMTRLDSRSLRAWNSNHIDILVQATPGTAGSLIRLLRSLSAAEFTSSSIPHLTIELPPDVDPATKQFLQDFQWPPSYIPNPTGAKYVSLRHRIPRQSLTEEESSARFLESFWPADPKNSHVLVLTPQVELAPNFFHYLKYTLLEYRYSDAAQIQHWDARLLGISLEQPLQLLDSKTQFTPPLSRDKKSQQDIASSFLWQSPTSHAMLFMGEKWVELHDLVSRSLDIQQKSASTPSLLANKLISHQHPSWLEYVLRLSKLRGYWALYPGEETARSLATVHRELQHAPEEYAQVEKPVTLPDKASEEEIQKAMEKLRAGPEFVRTSEASLQNLLDAGSLRPFGNLPLVSWGGQTTDLDELDESAAKYAFEFRTQVGKCSKEAAAKQRLDMTTQDLFCVDD
ncbi:hypothetical protein KJ359_009668 [Pestalotiopsis sp. 9143b]|nr:hypothetical protein KJ359_009668 [Pestalotiopsis sp. 9143b]